MVIIHSPPLSLTFGVSLFLLELVFFKACLSLRCDCWACWLLLILKGKTGLKATLGKKKPVSLNSHRSSWSCPTQVTVLVLQQKPDRLFWCRGRLFHWIASWLFLDPQHLFRMHYICALQLLLRFWAAQMDPTLPTDACIPTPNLSIFRV